MKKLLSLTLACLMIVSLLAACGGGSSDGGGSSGTGSGTTSTSGSGGSSGSSGGSTASAAKAQDLVMGTGSSGGTYFALRGAMANAINNKLADQKISVTAQATGASVENCNLIQAGEMDLGIAMNNVAANAVEGTGAFSAPCDKVKQSASCTTRYIRLWRMQRPARKTLKTSRA